MLEYRLDRALAILSDLTHSVPELVGAVLHAALMHGQPPADDVIESTVDLLLRGLG